MKTRTGLMAVTVLAALLAASTLVFAEHQGGPGNDDKARLEGREGFFRELNLTPQQQEQMKAHKARNMEQMKAIGDELRAKRTQLRAELEKPALDRAKITAIATEVKTLTGKMIDRRIEGLIELKGILTPEQFQKLMSKKHDRGPWKGKGVHRGGPGPGPGDEGPGGQGGPGGPGGGPGPDADI